MPFAVQVTPSWPRILVGFVEVWLDPPSFRSFRSFEVATLCRLPLLTACLSIHWLAMLQPHGPSTTPRSTYILCFLSLLRTTQKERVQCAFCTDDTGQHFLGPSSHRSHRAQGLGPG